MRKTYRWEVVGGRKVRVEVCKPGERPAPETMKVTVSAVTDTILSHKKTHTELLEANAHDVFVASKVQRKIKQLQKNNREEQKRVGVTALARKSIVANNPGLSAPEVDAMVLERHERDRRPHAAKQTTTSSPTAADLLREHRRKSVKGRSKYRR